VIDLTGGSEYDIPRIQQQRPLRTVVPKANESQTSEGLSRKIRRVDRATVPCKQQGEESRWKTPLEMDSTLEAMLMDELYKRMDDPTKAKRWKLYSMHEASCILTWVVGRGATISVWRKKFRACQQCIKKKRTCARIIMVDGKETLSFNALSGRERGKVSDWQSVAYYVRL
jgi:hypothetical protein